MMVKIEALCLGLIACFLLLGSTWSNTIEAAEGELSCRVDTGAWETSDGNLTLLGAICSTDSSCGDFYNFDFSSNTILYAQRFEGMASCDLRFLLKSADILFYGDDKKVYGIDAKTLKLKWVKELGELVTFARDPKDSNRFALLTGGEGERKILLLRVNSSNVELLIEEATGGASEIRWLKDRLVALGDEELFWWDDLGGSFVNKQSIRIRPALKPGSYHFDDAGLMVVNQAEPRVVYYRFASADRTVARINSTATVRAIGGSENMAMVMTTDMHVIRLVARLGTTLQNRFEVKYWDLPKKGGETYFFADKDVLVVAGAGETNSALIVATDDITWKRKAALSIQALSRLQYVDDQKLTAILDAGAGSKILSRWDLNRGQEISSLKAESLTQIPEFKTPTKVEKLFSDSAFDLLFDDAGNFTFLRREDLKLWSKSFQVKSHTSESLRKEIQEFQNGLAIADNPSNGKSTTWYVILGDEEKFLNLSDIFRKAKKQDALSPYEKWYGYCIDENDCIVSSETVGMLTGTTLPFEKTINNKLTHNPTLLAYLMAALALLLAFIVPLWRNGFAKKGHVSVLSSETSSSHSGMHFLDKRGRRFVTERDKSRFLHLSIFNALGVRLLLSIIAGLVLGLALSYRYYYDDSLDIFVRWFLILSMPVGSFVWILLSWNFWNRNYLLHFGRATEGVWFDSATPDQSICYAPFVGKTYRLKRGQWKKVDFVPIILFDPQRPHFALQYTGDGAFPLIPKLGLVEKKESASTHDVYFELIVLGLLSICIFLTQFSYSNAFPNPLSVWDMNRIEAKANEEGSEFVKPCLEHCFAGDNACADQCHQRQLRLIFNSAGIDLKDETSLTPRSVLELGSDAIEELESILSKHDEECTTQAALIRKLPLWTQELSTAFWKVYADEQIYENAGIAELDQLLKKKAADLQKLCVHSLECAKSPNSCLQAPDCVGNVESLKQELCAFGRSLRGREP